MCHCLQISVDLKTRTLSFAVHTTMIMNVQDFVRKALTHENEPKKMFLMSVMLMVLISSNNNMT